MIDDAQTHVLPKSAEGFDRLARFCGEGDTDSFRARLERKLRRVETITGAFFAPLEAEAPAPEIGEEAAAIVARWPGYPALRSTRGQEIFERLKPGFLAFRQGGETTGGAAEFRRVPARTAGGRAAFLDVRGQPAACRPDRRYQRHRAAPVALSLAPFGRARRRARRPVLRPLARAGGAGGGPASAPRRARTTSTASTPHGAGSTNGISASACISCAA
jgi:hypothetical protein